MKLYIPEIGDTIVLEKDWTFNLHGEDRNVQLGSIFGYYYTTWGWVSVSDLAPMRQCDYKIDYPSQEQFYTRTFMGTNSNHDTYLKACRDLEAATPEYVKFWEEYAEWKKNCEAIGVPFIPVTLPAGTTLKVDRIYIRKGVRDYSSVTFFAKDLGETTVKHSRWVSSNAVAKKIKSQRFWAKLADCNNIEFVAK